MGCTSAKHVSAVPSEEESKAYSNGDAFNDEYKVRGGAEVKYLHGEEERVNTRNQENLEKSAAYRGKQREAVGDNGKTNIHTSESQQEFFRMLDEKIEKGRDYCSEEEEVT